MTLLRGTIYFFFTFLFLRVYVPTENHTVESLGNFSKATFQSCLWRSGYSLCPTGWDTQLDSKVTETEEKGCQLFHWCGGGRVFRLNGILCWQRGRRECTLDAASEPLVGDSILQRGLPETIQS